MYKILDKQLKCIWYNPILAGRYLFANSLDKTVSIFELSNLEEKAKVGSEIGFVRVQLDYLLVQNSNSITVFEIENPESQFVLEGLQILPGQIDGEYLFCNTKDGQILKYDYISRKGIWKSNGQFGSSVHVVKSGLLYNQKSFFSRVVYCLSIDNGELLWEKDISDIGKYEEGDQVKKGKLNLPILTTDETTTLSLSNNLLVGLDSSTGKILWQSDGVAYLKPYGEMLYGLGASSYTEIDPKTGEMIKQINLEDQYKAFEIQNSAASYTVDEDYIYFNDVRKAKVGILEKATGNIIWTFKLPVKEGVTIPASNVPQIHENRMYILDSEGTLHIFEKE